MLHVLSKVLENHALLSWIWDEYTEHPQTLQSWFVSPIDLDRSPQGPAEVCRPCRFLLEIILPLVSLRLLPINKRSTADIQSSKPCLTVWTHSTKKLICHGVVNTEDSNHFGVVTKGVFLWQLQQLLTGQNGVSNALFGKPTQFKSVITFSQRKSKQLA